MSEHSAEALIRSIRRTLRGLVITTVILYAIAGALAYNAYIQSRDSSNALCALQKDIRSRVRSSVKFVADHPNGAFGIPAAVIIKQIADQQRTLKALDVLDC